MKKLFQVLLLICFTLTGLFAFSFSNSHAATELITMDSPLKCPDGGCAAGQRINFLLTFEVTPADISDPNTQICLYSLAESGSVGSEPWAELNRISNFGLLTSTNYQNGDPKKLCTPTNDEILLAGVYAELPNTAESDQLDLALTVSKGAAKKGRVRVEVFQAKAKDNFTLTDFHTMGIPVAVRRNTAYIGQTPDDCDGYWPCYVNSSDDEPDGIGTGLRDAVMAMNDGSEIFILNDYFLKDHAVLIDKNLTIRGNAGARITYNGGQYSEPMLIFQQGGAIKDLIINDGHWGSPSRTLLQIDSAEDLTIEHNTLTSGSYAVNVKDNTGDVLVIFNHIVDNDNEAIYSTKLSGNLSIYANNIINNGNIEQVHCSNLDGANHNFWGETSAEKSAPNCKVTNGKQLGAPILTSTGGAGVEALSKTVTKTMTYDMFDNDIGVMHTKGNDYNIIIINHGQGDETNIPFVEDSGAIDACSNFYDIFLSDNAVATNLVLSLKYDLTNACRYEIETSNYCGQQEDSSKYPLWWYDPANDITAGWDRTGQNPEGPGAGDALRQKTVCDLENNSINVTIDNTGRPGLTDDLYFTPFVTGLTISNITLSKFAGEFITSKVFLNWTTTAERNLKEFRIYRSETRSGDYDLIASGIEAIGDATNDSTIKYNYEDSSIVLNTIYFYKLEVIDILGESIKLFGPVEIYTANPTKTATLYPTLTPIYDPNTVTPRIPTQIRTYRPSPIPSRTNYIKLTATPTNTATSAAEIGYPVEPSESIPSSAYPTQIGIEEDNPNTPTQDHSPTPTKALAKPLAPKIISWVYLIIGVIGGMGIITGISLIMSKSQIF